MESKDLRKNSNKIKDPKVLLQQAENTLGAASELIHRSYLANLSSYLVLPADEYISEVNLRDVSLFKMERLVTENRESILESATAIYTALGAAGYSVFFLLDAMQGDTQLYIGTRAQHGSMKGSDSGELLHKTLSGHFPGSKLSEITNGRAISTALDFSSHSKQEGGQGEYTSVTAVTGIPALNSEERKYFTQGLERFLDAAEGETYQALFLAEPVSSEHLHWTRMGFEATASQLSPLVKQQLSYGVNESEAVANSLTESLSESLSQTVGQTQTIGKSTSTTHTVGTTKSTTKDPSMLVGSAASLVGLAVGGPLGAVIVGGLAKGVTSTFVGSKTEGESETKGTTEGETHTAGESTSNTSGTTKNSGTTNTQTLSEGSNRQLMVESINKPVEQLLARIDHHLERLDEARAYGGWNSAAYFVAQDTATSEALGSMFLGLMRGNESSAEDFALTTWNNGVQAERDSVLEWLKNLMHPRFEPDFKQYISVDYVTPASLLSGREIAIQLSLPRRSSTAVTVLEVPAYGRSVGLLDLDSPQQENTSNSILLGHLRHLWRDTEQELRLTLDKLCYHTLITGTTGVGKTTAIMSLLAQVHEKGIPFLTIEPAKGEYRQLLGLATKKRPVTYRVAGRTGPDALRINPFVFPEGIELSDHIDRVCTVFNAAFPMYAAMPQVLEEAIFTAYEELGWDSISSRNVGVKKHFPTLRRVADLIPEVVKRLGYSEQLSSDYIGALSTRLRSLCRGSLGMTLLCSADEETTDKELFETSAVVDLSPMGSPEKRALLMGILFMRMYEKRMTEGLPSEAELRHLMVLEEAHVLLKRTSTEQSQEGSNPRGLAVEAFSNALAEMRAYGQGFIVADQSASVLDDSVLRNTNTKIVMRAPFEADRIALGGALALTEEQTQQLARLENQTAVIHQSNWLEPVLCRIQRTKIPSPPALPNREHMELEKKEAQKKLVLALWQERLSELFDEDHSLNESELKRCFTILNISESNSEVLRKHFLVEARNHRVEQGKLKKQIEIILPELADTAWTQMTISEQERLNRLHLILSEDLGLSFDYVRNIAFDIGTLFIGIPFEELRSLQRNLEGEIR